MKLSQLEEELKRIREANGDLEVQLFKSGQRQSPWTSEKKLYITEGFDGVHNITGRIALFVAGKGEPLTGLATIITTDGETRIGVVGGEEVEWKPKEIETGLSPEGTAMNQEIKNR